MLSKPDKKKKKETPAKAMLVRVSKDFHCSMKSASALAGISLQAWVTEACEKHLAKAKSNSTEQISDSPAFDKIWSAGVAAAKSLAPLSEKTDSNTPSPLLVESQKEPKLVEKRRK
jgi:hypothetical protein